jgi:hypothetical protein
MRVRTARQEAETQFPGRRPVENLGEDRGRVVVAHDKEITGLRVHGNPGVAEMAVYDTRLVLLVVVDPKLHGRLAACHGLHDTAHLSGWKPGFATGSVKHDRNLAKVDGVASGKTTEKWRRFEKVAATSNPAARRSPQRASRSSVRRRI